MSSLSECWCFELFVELTLVCSQSRDAFDMDSWRTALGDGANRSGACRLRAGLGSAGVIGSGWLRACFSFSAASLISAWSWRMSVAPAGFSVFEGDHHRVENRERCVLSV